MVRLPKIVFFLALTVPVGAPGAAADEPHRLSPSSAWNVEYADESCRLERRFGEGDQSILLAMDRFQPGDYFRLSLTGHPLRRARPGDATLRFGPAEPEQRAEFLTGTMGDLPVMVFGGQLRIAPLTESERRQRRSAARDERRSFDPAPLGPVREQAVEYFYIDSLGLSPIVLETGSLAEPFRALRQCIDELLTHWGIDVEKHRSLTRRAIPTRPLASLLRSSDYPRGALNRGQQAIVNFRLIVDAQGRVSDCHIQQATQGRGFEQAVCDAITRRARFEPALDAEGNPIRSYYVGTVIFVIAG